MPGEVLGRGHFALVRTSNKGNAIKCIDIETQKPPHNWRAEVGALKALCNKENIVQIIDITENLKSMDPEVRIEMHRYRMTLEDVIYHYAKANYPPGSGWRNAMPSERVVSLILGLAAGISAIHACNIIHRDIKPENILFDEFDGEPVIIDFGVAWVPGFSERTEPEQNRITDVCTGEYKAPELLYGVSAYTSRIDLWALGCIIARLLSPNCSSLFSPYRSDITLLVAQFQVLGFPDLNECPTFQDPNIQSTIKNMICYAGKGIHGANLPLRKLPDSRTTNTLHQLANQLLQYEPNQRPDAAEVAQQLNNISNVTV